MYELFQVMSNECGTPKILVCPADERIASTNWGDPTLATSTALFNNEYLSYFYGVAAADTSPQSYLSGDRNIGQYPNITANPNSCPLSAYGYSQAYNNALGNYNVCVTNQPGGAGVGDGWTSKMHQLLGNVCLGDGSVQQYSPTTLKTGFAQQCDIGYSYGGVPIYFP
jgi:hypothetical protein